MLSPEEEWELCRRIAAAKLRLRRLICECEVVHQSAVELARQVQAGRRDLADVVQVDRFDMLQQQALHARLGDLVRDPAAFIAAIPFLDSHWAAFIARIEQSEPIPVVAAVRDQAHEVQFLEKELFDHFLPLADRIADDRADSGFPARDLTLAGQAGLRYAIATFDYAAGRGFAPYAVWRIREAIRQAIDTGFGFRHIQFAPARGTTN